MQGLHQETIFFFFVLLLVLIQTNQTNLLLAHGSCTVLGLDVPCLYFVQEILIGSGLVQQHVNQRVGVARFLVSAEVTERDKAFVRMVGGDESEQWWHKDNPEHYPPYGEILNIINEKVQAVCVPSF